MEGIMRSNIALLGLAIICAAVTLAACAPGDEMPTATNVAQPTSTPEPGGNGTPEATQEPGGTPGPDGAGDAAHGAELFVSTCAACHGQDATGIPGLGKDLVNSEFVSGLSDQELVEFINTGRPADDPANTTGVAMPPKGGNSSLTDQDVMDIVAHIRSLGQ
jgi:mono/diheme cytochrome c family protein